LQRFGSDSAARKPLLAERTRLLKALAEVEEKGTDAQEVNTLSKDLARVRNARSKLLLSWRPWGTPKCRWS
jgi:hypothetical protein